MCFFVKSSGEFAHGGSVTSFIVFPLCSLPRSKSESTNLCNYLSKLLWTKKIKNAPESSLTIIVSQKFWKIKEFRNQFFYVV